METDVPDLYLLIFREISGLGFKRIQQIFNKFQSFQNAFNSPLDDYKDIIKEKKILDDIKNLINNKEKTITKVKELNRMLRQNQIYFISFFNKKFPENLKRIDNPPIGLYFKGNFLFNELEKSVSIIGTRNPSFYGHKKARSIAKELAENGYIIISGLARGIDLEAHIGALDGGGKTIAVLGAGIDKIYPEEHSNLAEDIIKNGAIVSEFGIDQNVKKFNLVNRNRIVSGLSSASLIIEGDLDSGTRHEANFAKEQNKLIFVLKPLDLDRKVSQLPISLIKNNAIEIESSADILKCLNSKTIIKEQANLKEVN